MNDRRRHHGMGGLDGGPVDRDSHDHAPWEKLVDALKMLLFDDKRQLVNSDELRRGIEDLGADAYDRYSYYERWMAAITNVLLEKQVLSVEELADKMAQIEARQEVKLA